MARKTFPLEKRVLSASAHTWSLSAILSIYGVVNEIYFLDISDFLVYVTFFSVSVAVVNSLGFLTWQDQLFYTFFASVAVKLSDS